MKRYLRTTFNIIMSGYILWALSMGMSVLTDMSTSIQGIG